MAKKVSVTSVTPAIKVKASTPKEQASTRKTVGMIASAIPAGRAVKAAATAVKTAKAAKAASIAQKKNYMEKVTIPAKKVVEAAKAEKAANAAKDSKRVVATYAKTKQAVPTKVFNKTTPPIYKHAETDAILEQQWAKAVKAAEKTGMDIKKMKITIGNRTIDHKGIK